MNCKQCNKELTGKKQYCGDACRMAYRRLKGEQQVAHHYQPEQESEQITNPNTQPEHYATRTNPDKLNWGTHMNPVELDKAGFKANRVPIPGDYDYAGCCVLAGNGIGVAKAWCVK